MRRNTASHVLNRQISYMGSLYNIISFIHSWNRWIIVIAGLLPMGMAISYLSSKKIYNSSLHAVALTWISSTGRIKTLLMSRDYCRQIDPKTAD